MLSQAGSATFDQLEESFKTREPLAFYIVVRNRYRYQELQEFNESDFCHCKWFDASVPDDSFSEATRETIDEDHHGFGAIRFQRPLYLHGKRKNGYEGVFLFGRLPKRGRFVDVVLSRGVNISRVHFGLFYSWQFDYNWMIQSTASTIIVNHLFLLDKSTSPLALRSLDYNIVQVGQIELELYCNPRYWVFDDSALMFSDLRLNSCDGSQTISTSATQTSITTTSGSIQPPGNTETVYLFPNRSREGRRKEWGAWFTASV
jgi:hypothetical protein